eukprot:scaffold1237_cov243-Pinguiococcus_pyrenoidosus.AAC.43
MPRAVAPKLRRSNSMRLAQDPEGRPRGFAFVTMVDLQGAEKAIQETDGVEFDGRALKVSTKARRRCGAPTFDAQARARHFAYQV